ncbi:hypothetical protein FH972_019560 [Carpinus fangiana]|uniref:Uncharacterized protein n=1 Tax=Carpinus fangiana TaxID=176857 RepID=A0A5N6RQH3_9ROSI|nr:hypothetical protein FH972_019560 [Carpinus fangiana]
MNSKGTKYGVVASYNTIYADDPWKMKIFEATQRYSQPAIAFDFSWRLVMIHSLTTNVLIYNLLQTPIAHSHLEEEVDPPPPVVEGPPSPVADVVERPPPSMSDVVKGPPLVVDVVAALDPALVVEGGGPLDRPTSWGGREGGSLNPPPMVVERGKAMDPPPEKAASVVEEEADPPWPRTGHGELEIFDRFLASHRHDNSADAN